MRSLPIRYTRDMDAARRFYEALGLEVDFASRPPRHGPTKWMELRAKQGGLALHHTPTKSPSPEVELSFLADEPLETVVERLAGAGHEPATAIIDEAFGRSFTVRDPEGLLIQINEHDRDFRS